MGFWISGDLGGNDVLFYSSFLIFFSYSSIFLSQYLHSILNRTSRIITIKVMSFMLWNEIFCPEFSTGFVSLCPEFLFHQDTGRHYFILLSSLINSIIFSSDTVSKDNPFLFIHSSPVPLNPLSMISETRSVRSFQLIGFSLSSRR